MSFRDEIERFKVKVSGRSRALYVGLATAVQESVKTGRPETGAPGQPVESGNLRESWDINIGPDEASIFTNAAYAEAIENGIGKYGPLTLRSAVGGFHSVELTVTNADALQAAVLREVSR